MNKWIKFSAWLVFIIVTIILISFASSKQEQVVLNEPEVFIKITDDNPFITEKEIKKRLERANLIYTAQQSSNLNTDKIESFIKSMSEIKTCKVYRELGNKWHIDVEIRKPIARIFNKYAETYYLDEDGFTFSTSSIHTARVLVFTGNIPDRKGKNSVDIIINNDTLKTNSFLDEIYRISTYVCNDPILGVQIGQVHLNEKNEFLLVPRVGEHKIIFGSAYSTTEVETKCLKLKQFYANGLPYEGWNKYQSINLKYDKQIVCKK